MTTFDAEAFAFLSSIKEPALKDGTTRIRLLDMMNNLTAPHPYEIMQWLQMAEFRAFAFDNLRVEPEEVEMELEYRYDEWAYETDEMSIDMPYEHGDLSHLTADACISPYG
ncbi:hypothetical protein FMEXI_5603 [Fusarium mexicanum]|uniref:Uncharacterized protein n=1 Tax=Fusarium mexicanum TaxID=751941 RepID=A0A8H5N026_9HYPO|nr:hypothetical protein FMEXI_5603 [Fusarium mexicanum]